MGEGGAFFFCLFGDVAFSEYICTIFDFSLYGEYVVRSFLPNGAFLPCHHGLDFFTSTYVRNQSTKKKYKYDTAYCTVV